MKCRQPGCTGTIVDGYCDVCGMPGPAASPVGRAQPGIRPSTRSSGPCRMPGCGGRIVDGYCDVCGSPDVSDIAPTPAAGAGHVAHPHLGAPGLDGPRFGTGPRPSAAAPPGTAVPTG